MVTIHIGGKVYEVVPKIVKTVPLVVEPLPGSAASVAE